MHHIKTGKSPLHYSSITSILVAVNSKQDVFTALFDTATEAMFLQLCPASSL